MRELCPARPLSTAQPETRIPSCVRTKIMAKHTSTARVSTWLIYTGSKLSAAKSKMEMACPFCPHMVTYPLEPLKFSQKRKIKTKKREKTTWTLAIAHQSSYSFPETLSSSSARGCSHARQPLDRKGRPTSGSSSYADGPRLPWPRACGIHGQVANGCAPSTVRSSTEDTWRWRRKTARTCLDSGCLDTRHTFGHPGRRASLPPGKSKFARE